VRERSIVEYPTGRAASSSVGYVRRYQVLPSCFFRTFWFLAKGVLPSEARIEPRSIVSCCTISCGFPWRASRSGAFQSQYVVITMRATKRPTRTKKSLRTCAFTSALG
jgi:hypothetical protein